VKSEKSEEYKFIPIEKLVKSPLNVRRVLGDIKSLKKSIKVNGLQEPLVVRPAPGKEGFYEIIIGYRRYVALKELVEEGEERFRLVPCIVRDLSDVEAARLSLEENLARQELTPEELADGIKLLLNLGMTIEQIADMLSISLMEAKILAEGVSIIKELGLEVEKKAGRGREIVVKKTIEEKAPEVVPELKEVKKKEIVEVKPKEEKKPLVKEEKKIVREEKVEEERGIEEEIEEMKKKIPFSHLLIIYGVVDFMERKGVIKENERNIVLRDILKVVTEHALRQVELRKMCSRIRQYIRVNKDYRRAIEDFLRERYSTVELKIRVPYSIYVELEERAKSENKSVDDVIVEMLSKVLK